MAILEVLHRRKVQVDATDALALEEKSRSRTDLARLIIHSGGHDSKSQLSLLEKVHKERSLFAVVTEILCHELQTALPACQHLFNLECQLHGGDELEAVKWLKESLGTTKTTMMFFDMVDNGIVMRLKMRLMPTYVGGIIFNRKLLPTVFGFVKVLGSGQSLSGIQCLP